MPIMRNTRGNRLRTFCKMLCYFCKSGPVLAVHFLVAPNHTQYSLPFCSFYRLVFVIHILFKQIENVTGQRIAYLNDCRSIHTSATAFIFVDFAEGNIEFFGEFRLAHRPQLTVMPDPSAYININWICFVPACRLFLFCFHLPSIWTNLRGLFGVSAPLALNPSRCFNLF